MDMLKGLSENRPIDKIKGEIAKLQGLKDHLIEAFRRAAGEHLSLAGKSSSMKLTYSELFKDGQALSIRLLGLRAENRRLTSLLGLKENAEPRDSEMIDKYVLSVIRE